MAKPFPPRYFVGFMVFEDGSRIEGHDVQMVPAGPEFAVLIFTFPAKPLQGFMTIPKITSPLLEIQYSVNCLDNADFLIETLHHRFEKRDTYLSSAKGRNQLPYLISCVGPLFRTVPANYVFKDISKSVWPVVQFVS